MFFCCPKQWPKDKRKSIFWVKKKKKEEEEFPLSKLFFSLITKKREKDKDYNSGYISYFV
jgi:hypothetical protein